MPKNSPLLFLVLPALLAVGCTTEEGGPAAPLSSGLPCEVEEVLAERCQTCHAAEPIAGAPMPLMTWRDFQKPSVTDPEQTVWQRVLARLEEDTMPPPMSPDLDEGQEEVMFSWLRGGAPQTDAGETCEPPTVVPDAGVEPGDCDGDVHRFIAYGEGDTDSAFHVPADQDNLYMCFAFPSTFAAGDLATRFDVEVGDARVLHHLILYSTPEEPVGDVFPCAEMPGDVTFVSGWAPGGGPLVMPEGVGAEVPGPTEWLILQAHYWNVAGHADAFDRSGITACTSDEGLDQTAAMVRLGNRGFEIPARTRDYAVTGDCEVPDALSEPLRVLGTASHMHLTGTQIWTEILRGGDEARSEDLARITDWDFNTQGYAPMDGEFWIDPGDVARTTCVYDNPGDQPIRNGERTEDEMCLQFALVVPAPPAGYRNCTQVVR